MLKHVTETAPSDRLRVGLAQISPVLLDRDRTLEKVERRVSDAADAGCALVAFGEALVPGYPFWLERTDAARFDSRLQKELHAAYLAQAVQPETGHLDGLRQLAARRGIQVVLGCVERAADRGGHSLYAALIWIDGSGRIAAVHRKLMPTYEERLSWAPGDGHGLRVHTAGPFTAGALNCWENWMPLPRAALYGLGEDLHLALWPGGEHNTRDVTRFLAREGRSYVLSVSGLMRRGDLATTIPYREALHTAFPEVLADGGSCVAGPDGSWVVPPVVGQEELIVADLDHAQVRAERQNFDPAGHYARPDVTRLVVNRRRLTTLDLDDGP